MRILKSINFSHILCVLMIVLAIGLVPLRVFSSEDIALGVKTSILIEADTGAVLSENGADERVKPASLTKIMLLIIVAEEMNKGKLSPDDEVVASENAFSKDGSIIWLNIGEDMSVRDLVKSVVIASANDAAVALAEHIEGSEDAFVKRMNEKATLLNMVNTNFDNAVGYDSDNHFTTARDIAIMSRELMRDENYVYFKEDMLTRLSSVRTGTERETQLLNTNKLISTYDGIEGIKTGTTEGAGYCLSTSARRGDMRLIGVVTGCRDDDERVEASKSLLDFGFNGYEVITDVTKIAEEMGLLDGMDTIKVKGGVKGEADIGFGDADAYDAYNRYNENKEDENNGDDDSIGWKKLVLPKGRKGDISFKIYFPQQVTAPIKKGQPIGILTGELDEKSIYEGYIIAEEEVEKLTLGRVFVGLTARFFRW